MTRTLIAALAMVPCLAEPGAASPCALAPGPRAIVSAVIDGDTVGLDDGREVRLLGIAAPKPPLSRPADASDPLGETARARLAALVLGHEVALAFGGARSDRHGRTLAHLYVMDGSLGEGGALPVAPATAPVWIEAALVAGGHARIMSLPDNRACIEDLLVLERAARAARRGLWASRDFAVRSVAETPRFLDRFEVVEGRVMKVAELKDWTYLNFGEDYRTDFTVSIARSARRSFKEAGLDLQSLEGKPIRVRGWIAKLNGPMIEVTHPEEIELLEELEFGAKHRPGGTGGKGEGT